MKELQEALIKKIGELVQDADETDVQLLDVLNRLLGTVSAYLLGSKAA